MISSRFCDRFLGWLDWVQPHHTLSGSSGDGHGSRVTLPCRASVGDPERRLFVHPTIVDGVDDGRRPVQAGDVRADRGRRRRSGRSTRRSRCATARLRPVGLDLHDDPLDVFRFRERISAGMVSVNNSTTGAEAHLPFGGNGRSGNGARQSGVWVLDQVHSLAGDELGLLRRLQKAQMDVADVSADPSFRLTEP
jgi:aldehyde dehydrogenase (NAD+)